MGIFLITFAITYFMLSLSGSTSEVKSARIQQVIAALITAIAVTLAIIQIIQNNGGPK